MSFFSELKRRNVFKVAVAYAIVAWLLIQVVATVLPTFDAPRWVQQTITFIIILGFPLALFLAWVYELTPEGIKTTASEGPAQYHTQATGMRLNYFIVGVLVLAVAFILIDNYVLVDKPGSTKVTATEVMPVEVKSNASLSSTATTPSPPASPAAAKVRRTLIDVGATHPFTPTGVNVFVTVSRDGSHLVYAANTDGTSRLYYRALDQLEARALPGTEHPFSIFLSPDGEWVGYIKENVGLHKVSTLGGPPQQLAEQIGWGRGGFWSETGDIYYINVGKLDRVAANGGKAEPVKINSEHANWYHAWPYGLPDGKHLLLTVGKEILNSRNGQIVLLDLTTGDDKTLIGNAYNARYVTTGHIVFMRSGSLWAVPFDATRLETTGPEVPVVNGMQTNGNTGNTPYTFSDNGMLIYLAGEDVAGGGGGVQVQLVWVNRTGKETPLAAKGSGLYHPHLSPDGTQVVVGITGDGASNDIWTYDIKRNIMSRRTFSGNAVLPSWSPDGSHLVYTFWPAMQGLAWVRADGTGQPEKLLDAPRLLVHASFTPDGKQLVYNETISGPQDIYTLALAGEQRTEQKLLATKFNEFQPSLSPDGRWLAYVSTETGQNEVYVRPYPKVDGGKWQISADGGIEPRWRGDSKELFYRRGQNPITIMAVPVETEKGFQTGAPSKLFSGDYLVDTAAGSYDVTRDGQRFLTIKTVGATNEEGEVVSEKTNLVVVDNWFAELQRLAPPAK